MDGTRAWLLQRVSAVYMGLFLLLFPAYLVYVAPDSYQAWHDFVACRLVSLSLLLFFFSLLIHAWVGVRDVIIDYVHNPGLRLLKLTLTGLVLIACGLWIMSILFVVMI